MNAINKQTKSLLSVSQSSGNTYIIESELPSVKSLFQIGDQLRFGILYRSKIIAQISQ